ncbi:MAG: 2-C-methyl-D-erythritol 2,4-cyclodiphosphate synthase [Bacteroidetes Order II. Incertae sedis bacterium]|nr:2-C-methyl-D-erythritol 2,4-cyclodiphosphate synthase [Bacteroidetes Order II. bacterium]
MRIGFGYDVHRLMEGRPFILGGVEIPFEKGLLGHSDADVLLHAITDALLGAAALGDIGAHFPDNDPNWKGANSRHLLRAVMDLIYGAGYKVGNVDATVVLERPKLRPLIDQMRAHIAEDLSITIGQVSVKATTNERMGFVGRQEGVACHAVCLLLQR